MFTLIRKLIWFYRINGLTADIWKHRIKVAHTDYEKKHLYQIRTRSPQWFLKNKSGCRQCRCRFWLGMVLRKGDRDRRKHRRSRQVLSAGSRKRGYHSARQCGGSPGSTRCDLAGRAGSHPPSGRCRFWVRGIQPLPTLSKSTQYAQSDALP